MSNDETLSSHDRWARFRFGVIGPLLSAPPRERGELRREIERLAARTWKDPLRGEPTTFGVSTIERWYYRARKVTDPLKALRKKVRSDRGSHPSLSEALKRAIHAQHRSHPTWAKQLHYDNLVVLAAEGPKLGTLPSYVPQCAGTCTRPVWSGGGGCAAGTPKATAGRWPDSSCSIP